MGSVRVRCCRECKTVMAAEADYRAEFCGKTCRNRFNNRRMLRGSELYDLFMCLRYERSLAKTLGLWGVICTLASRWRADDVAQGIKSYKRPQEVLERR